MAGTPGRKRFTIQQANATLPLVRAIVTDLVRLAEDIADRRQRLSLLLAGYPSDRKDPYREELLQIEEGLEQDSRQLQSYAEELRQLGVEPRMEGLVDFPAELDGREVFLCWRLGEPEVLHWHELDAGFAGRRPLTADLAPR